jgi:glycosyltransferase involved in cell wall biosynthesis
MLTVFIATKDRARILREVLESYCRLEQPQGGWKLVVVDNGSNDETEQVVSSFGKRIPVRYILESRPGKNFALNTGLELLEGDLAVFTDDDALPRPDWLVQLRRVADTQPDYSMFGGVIVPRWETTPPDWISWVPQSPVYSVTDPTWKEGPIEAINLFGPNMAVRSQIFQSGHRFDTSIGPRGSNYPMGSETEFVLRIARQGYRAWHVEAGVVEHLIQTEQMRKSWVWQRALRLGRGRYRLSFLAGEREQLFFGIPRFLFWDIPKKAVRVVLAFLTLRRKTLFHSIWYFNFRRGQAIEARIIYHERRGRIGDEEKNAEIREERMTIGH